MGAASTDYSEAETNVKELKTLRDTAGLTQQQLARRMGVCQQRIAQMEGDERVSAETEHRFREAVREAVEQSKAITRAIMGAVSGDRGFVIRKIGTAEKLTGRKR